MCTRYENDIYLIYVSYSIHVQNADFCVFVHIIVVFFIYQAVHNLCMNMLNLFFKTCFRVKNQKSDKTFNMCRLEHVLFI